METLAERPVGCAGGGGDSLSSLGSLPMSFQTLVVACPACAKFFSAINNLSNVAESIVD